MGIERASREGQRLLPMRLVILAVLLLPLLASAPAEPVVAATTATVTENGLRLRTGPGTEHAILTHMNRGTVVTVLDGPVNGWYQVDLSGTVGWAFGQYLAVSSAPAEPAPAPAPTGSTATVTEGGLRLRTGPGTNYSIITMMHQGETLPVVGGPSSGWYQLNRGGTIGWASGQFLSVSGPTAPAPTPEPTPPPAPTPTPEPTPDPGTTPGGTGVATVNVSALNLRSGPGTNYPVVRLMYQNEAVTILSGPSGGWFQVSYAGVTGWAFAEYLTLAGNPTAPTPSTTATVDVDQLNLRSGPGTTNPVITRMLLGETVKIVGTSGEWYQVDYHGTAGWAFGSYLRFGGESTSFWVPVHQQLHSLSCEYASLQIATAALGEEIHEDRFIPVVGQAANPHHGFRGNIDGTYIFGTDDYGVYPEPLAAALPTFGFTGEVFYGGVDQLKAHLQAGKPVVVWLDLGYTTSFTMMIDGEPVTMAPRSHVVVAYGYSSDGVLISDPDSSNPKRLVRWGDFEAMWNSMDGMALAVSR